MMHDVHVTNEEQINCSRVTDWVEDMEVVERKAPTSNGGSSPDIGSDSPDAQKRSNKYIIYLIDLIGKGRCFTVNKQDRPDRRKGLVWPACIYILYIPMH